MKRLAGIGKIWNLVGPWHRKVLHVVFLTLVGSAVYSNSLKVPFILDDHYNIDFIGQRSFLEHLLHGGARRVADSTFALNYSIHGFQLVGYHLTNLAIHLLSSITLYYIVIIAINALRESYAVKECTEEESSLLEQFTPFAIALLFVSHPVQTQAVTYIIQRYASLATFFYLLSTFFFIRTRITLERSGICWKLFFQCVGILVSGILAAGSKQIAATLPLMLLLLEIFLFRARLLTRRFYITSGIFFITFLTLVLVKWYGSSLADFLFDLRHATSEDQYISRTSYFFTQIRVLVTYIRLLCLPLGLNLVRDSPIYSSLLSLHVIASLALHIVLVTIATILFRMSEKNLHSNDCLLGVFQRLASLGVPWFYIAMAVESSIFPISDVIFEHRIYLPSVGFFITIVAITALAVQCRRINYKSAWILLVAVIIIFGSMTVARNNVWNDSLSIWQDSVNKSPNKWLALANLAGEYMDRKMPDKALPLLVRTIELQPSLYINYLVSLGDALKALNISETRFTTGQEFVLPGGVLGSGTIDYKNLTKWESVISNNMGLAYEYLNEPKKAIISYKVAVAINPSYDLAWFNLALISTRLGDKMQADEALKQLTLLNRHLGNTISSNRKSDIPSK